MASVSAFPIIARKLLKEEKLLHLFSPASAPLSSTNTIPEVYKRAGFDCLAIVIFAAFLGCFLFTLAVSTMVCCAFRCAGRIMGIDLLPDSASAHTHSNGSDDCIKRGDLKALPPVLYGALGTGFIGVDCPICLAEFVQGEKLRVFPQCNHSFHAECIEKWLVRNPSCPSCRRSLLQENK